MISFRQIRNQRWRRFTLIAALVFLAAIAHRAIGLSEHPRAHETNDEYFYLWCGMSLLKGESPTSWSQLQVAPQFAAGTVTWEQETFTIVRPVFDHPPLFSLLLGAVGWLSPHQAISAVPQGAALIEVWAVDILWIRLFSLALFASAYWLLLALALRIASPSVAIGSCAFYAFLEPVVVHSRLAVADNLAVVLLLSLLLLLEKHARRQLPFRVTCAAGITAGALLLTKLIALSAVPAVAAWVAVRKAASGPRAFYVVLAGTAGGGVLLGLYYTVYGWSAALDAMRIQSGRFYDLAAFFDLLRHQPVVHQERLNYWLMAGWICVVHSRLAVADNLAVVLLLSLLLL